MTSVSERCSPGGRLLRAPVRSLRWGLVPAILPLLVGSAARAQPAAPGPEASPAAASQEAAAAGGRGTGTSAEDADAKTRTLARDLAIQGARAFEAEDWGTALDRFDRALKLFPAPSVAIMKARCLVRLGRLLEALTRYEQIQRMPIAPDAPKPFRDALADAKTEAEEVRVAMPRLRISVRAARGEARGMTVQIDGASVPSVLVGVDCPIDPGTHEIAVSAPGYRTETRRISLEPRQRLELDVPLTDLRMVASAEPAQPALAATGAATTERAPSGFPWGWTVAGTGVAALGVSLITGVVAMQKKSSLDEVCTPGCPPSRADDLSSFRTNRDWSYGGLGVGVAFAAVGGYLLWRNSEEPPRVSASAGPGSIAVRATF